jgi:hypothetical protein
VPGSEVSSLPFSDVFLGAEPAKSGPVRKTDRNNPRPQRTVSALTPRRLTQGEAPQAHAESEFIGVPHPVLPFFYRGERDGGRLPLGDWATR